MYNANFLINSSLLINFQRQIEWNSISLILFYMTNVYIIHIILLLLYKQDDNYLI